MSQECIPCTAGSYQPEEAQVHKNSQYPNFEKWSCMTNYHGCVLKDKASLSNFYFLNLSMYVTLTFTRTRVLFVHMEHLQLLRQEPHTKTNARPSVGLVHGHKMDWTCAELVTLVITRAVMPVLVVKSVRMNIGLCIEDLLLLMIVKPFVLLEKFLTQVRMKITFLNFQWKSFILLLSILWI